MRVFVFVQYRERWSYLSYCNGSRFASTVAYGMNTIIYVYTFNSVVIFCANALDRLLRDTLQAA